MAAKKTNWGAVAAAVGVVAVAWYFLAHRRAAASGGPSYGGGSGSGVPLFPGSNSPKPSAGAGLGGLGSPLSALFGHGNPLKNWINSVLNQGYANAAGLPIDSSYMPGLGTSPDLSIPLQPTSLFDVNQLATALPGWDTGAISPQDSNLSDFSIPYDAFNWGSSSPSDFLVTQDIPQTADLSSYGIDPYAGSDSVSLWDSNSNLDLTSAYQGQYDLGAPSGGY